MEVMSLYPAKSLFLDGDRNTIGKNRQDTLQMIIDAGFTIKSDKSAEELLLHEGKNAKEINYTTSNLKSDADLHPARQ
jgi:hypothetical protein